MPPRTLLLISSDHVGWTELRVILSGMAGVRIIGDTADLRQAADLLATTRPEIIIAEAFVGGTATVVMATQLICSSIGRVGCEYLVRAFLSVGYDSPRCGTLRCRG